MSYPLTVRAQRALARARHEAERLGSADVDTPHLLLGLVFDLAIVAATVLQDLGLDLRAVQREVETMSSFDLALEVGVPDSGLQESLGLQQLKARAQIVMTQLGHTFIGTEHLLLALVEIADNNLALAIFAQNSINPDDVRRLVYEALGVEMPADLSIPTRDRASFFQTVYVSF